MTYSNKITSMFIMALVLLVGYSLGGISGMNFQDRMTYAERDAGITSDEGDADIILDNQQSSQKFTLQMYTKEHFNIHGSVPETIEPGQHLTVKGDTTNMIHDGIVHLYYTYGKNYTA
ncbi:MAG: hypothetical protein ACPKPY_05335 [Nitrososphaeraceae archaeon]